MGPVNKEESGQLGHQELKISYVAFSQACCPPREEDCEGGLIYM